MRRLVIAVVVGAVIGGLLGYYGQCTTGTCPLTANPWRGAAVGAILGLLFGLSSTAGAKAPAKPVEDGRRGLLRPGVAAGEDGSEPDQTSTEKTDEQA